MTMGDKAKGALKGFKLHINRFFIVSETHRKKGIGSFFLTQVIQSRVQKTFSRVTSEFYFYLLDSILKYSFDAT